MNLKKLCVGLCALAVAIPSTFAATTTAPEIVQVTFSPANPVQGDAVTAFIEVTPFTSSQPVNPSVQATLDDAGSPALPLLHPSNTLWIAQLGSFGTIAGHQLFTSVSIQDAQDAKTLHAQITQLDAQLADLQDRIKHTVDPNPRTRLHITLPLSS